MAELEARLRGMALNDVGGGTSGGNVEVVRRWIEAGGNVNVKGDSRWGVPPTAAVAARIRAARLGDTPSLATRLYALPAPLVWNVLAFWASARDPDY